MICGGYLISNVKAGLAGNGVNGARSWSLPWRTIHALGQPAVRSSGSSVGATDSSMGKAATNGPIRAAIAGSQSVSMVASSWSQAADVSA